MNATKTKDMDERALWLAIRRALLMVVDAIEHELGISPRTAELRKADKTQ